MLSATTAAIEAAANAVAAVVLTSIVLCTGLSRQHFQPTHRAWPVFPTKGPPAQ